MHTRTAFTFSSLALAAVFALAGCTNGATDDAPGADTDTLDVEASTSSNGWTSTANTPTLTQVSYNSYINQYIYDARASASFTRQSGSTSRKIGVCLLSIDQPPIACTTAADCPDSFGMGGSKYCSQVDGAGAKVCMFRKGSPSSYCAGSPVTGLSYTGPRSFTTPAVRHGDGPGAPTFVSYACFEACLASDPSVSSSSTVWSEQNGGSQCGGGPMCGSVCC